MSLKGASSFIGFRTRTIYQALREEVTRSPQRFQQRSYSGHEPRPLGCYENACASPRTQTIDVLGNPASATLVDQNQRRVDSMSQGNDLGLWHEHLLVEVGEKLESVDR